MNVLTKLGLEFRVSPLSTPDKKQTSATYYFSC